MAHAGDDQDEQGGQDRQLKDFIAVFRSEVDSINKRRQRLRELRFANRPDIALEDETGPAPDRKPLVASDETIPLRPTDESEVVGLALSGGGIRSAAFSLGVLQALYKCGLIRMIDYLSTVSGGGYIGTSLTAGMTANGGHFPFKSYLSEDETPSLQHVRDHSNYLFPNGAQDLLSNASIYARGLVANFILILPFLLGAAIVTIALHPVAAKTDDSAWHHFVVSLWCALALLAVLIGWGIVRSTRRYQAHKEAPTRWTKIFGWLVIGLLVIVLYQLQQYILDAMLAADQREFFPSLVALGQRVIIFITPAAAVVAFLAKKFGEVIKSALESERVRDQIAGYTAKAAVYVAAAIVPLLLWVTYLQFTYWGMCAVGNDCKAVVIPQWLWWAANGLDRVVPHAAEISAAAKIVFSGKRALILLYLVVTVICLIVIYFLRPNANSLHPLYRDRLRTAFLFRPEITVPRDPDTNSQPALEELHLPLSKLSESDAPYQLINTALNVQNSKEVNRRGRNADFFLLSRNFVGSRATRYVSTRHMEDIAPGFDLASAVAISGAAVSSNMGSATIKPLTATIAMLNIRLGYWLPNPKFANSTPKWSGWENFYFLAELFGLLNEECASVYLSDGGHIENLGLYELLRRRCKVIIVVDAEADPQMAFGAFNVLERYALIDLGVRIDLPWQKVANATKAAGGAIDKKGDAPKKAGPHVAVGEISYPGGRKGVLVYIKSSLTGDENDYVFHYKKRYGAFPHETTLDQMFTEEQFEAYRALGFHAADRFFDRRDCFAYPDPAANPCIRDQIRLLDRLFPVFGDDPCAPRPYATFEARMTADLARAAAEKAKRDAAETCCADIAEAAGRVATAAQTVAGTLAPGSAAPA